jgi:hypothetical protein
MSPTLQIIRRAKWDQTTHPQFPFRTTDLTIYRYIGIEVPDTEIYHRGRALGYVHRNHLHILRFYSWNGMTLYPEDQHKDKSLAHDFHYQTGLLKRRHADKILANMARTHDAFHWGIYLGVRIGGWRFYAKDPHITLIRENTSDDHDLGDDLAYT